MHTIIVHVKAFFKGICTKNEKSPLGVPKTDCLTSQTSSLRRDGTTDKEMETLFYQDAFNNTEENAALVRELVSFATDFGLEGNVWQQWLTYKLITDENPFSLACERRAVRKDSTLRKLAMPDLTEARRMMHSEAPPMMTEYCPPYADSEMTPAGRRLRALSLSLAEAQSDEAFCDCLTAAYEKYGCGDFSLFRAFRASDIMEAGGSRNPYIVPVSEASDVTFDDLIGYEKQKETLRANTEAFVNGQHANNVLLYGDSGPGKSTSVHALMHEYYDRGLRLIEISKQQRHLMPQIMSGIKRRNYRFILFLDDLSFEENESDYKELKAMLEGALEKREDRVLIYATSNRRHLIRETWGDRQDMEYNEDIHRSDTMEEKLSLAARFGVTIYYPKPLPREYMDIVRSLAGKKGLEIDSAELEDTARKWELRHGGMSGRTASQLITWLEGQQK